jgi:hypothetical protein
MGFFKVLKRLAKGQPPFEPPTETNVKEGEETPTMTTETPRSTGPKKRPEVEIERTTTHTNGSRIDIDCIIQNNADEKIELDKIHFLGTSRELDSYLRPGEERQYRIYSGNHLQQAPQGYAELYYKDPSGNYFCAIHRIESQKQADGTYEIEDFDLTYPIKDV